jgi:hypothetical protein
VTDEQNITAGVAVLVGAFVLWCLWQSTRTTKRNIRRTYRDVLPPPSPACERCSRLAER